MRRGVGTLVCPLKSIAYESRQGQNKTHRHVSPLKGHGLVRSLLIVYSLYFVLIINRVGSLLINFFFFQIQRKESEDRKDPYMPPCFILACPGLVRI